MSNGVIRITLLNIFIMGASAMVFERSGKLIFSRFRINGLSELFGA